MAKTAKYITRPVSLLWLDNRSGTEKGTDGEYDEYKETDYEGEGYDYSLDHLPQDDFQVESERTTQEKFPKSSSKVPSR